MDSAALELERHGRRAYVIPEGGSNGLGALGYVEAMREVKLQLGLGLGGGPAPFDLIVHACGSGGTAAGIALGAAHFGVARAVRTMAVCDDAAYFERAIERIAGEARSFDPALTAIAPLTVDDAAKGPAYGVMSAEQRRFLIEVARASGLVLDPVYTGKALFGLAQAAKRGDVARGARVLFVHTGGLPGLLSDGGVFTEELTAG
jgi:D-cysteine desulfhydrase